MNIIKGRVFSFLKRPEDISDLSSFLYIEEGAVLFDESGIIEEVDTYSSIKKRYNEATVNDFGSSLICPGFIDVHNHFPQTQVIASYGAQLLDWLNKYTFPDNTKEGFDTGALPIIWEEKDKFTKLMLKASEDMIKLASVIEDSDEIRGTLTKFMWSNCKACHNRYREEH